MNKDIEWKIGDCMELIDDVEENSVDLAIVDPAYFKIVPTKWDREWRTINQYLNWLEKIMLKIRRVMKRNGSIYVFGDDKNISYVQVRLDKHYEFLNHIFWHKPNNRSIIYPQSYYRYACVSERILFYGMKKPKLGKEAKRTYNYIKGVYEIINVPMVGGSELLGHPTQKPVALLEKLILISSNENDLVLDPFLGSGSTLAACRMTNRRCIGFEKDSQWLDLYSKRSKADIPRLVDYWETVESNIER
jgi:site-specific DNA-methyltransferase (adenine-specific)